MQLFLLLWQVLFSTASTESNFEIQEIDNQVSIGYGIAIGDVDGDGKPDILLADKNEFVWYRNGDWQRFVMVENLTEYDNVCIAARDINGDGQVEVAVGAQWNPGETSDPNKSGSVHFLIRPDDPTQKWTAVQLHHEPTVHRMRWAKTTQETFQLIMLPLHGRGNVNGEGKGVSVIAYEVPDDPKGKWNYKVIDSTMHLTHNLDVVKMDEGSGESILIGGKEGVKVFSFVDGRWSPSPQKTWLVKNQPFGELKLGKLNLGKQVLVGISPMHGNMVTVHEEAGTGSQNMNKFELDKQLKQGHGVGLGDFLGLGQEQVVAGWREANESGDYGIKLYVPKNGSFSEFSEHWIDQNGMACEDLQVADLDGDGKLDIIASGRGTHNLRIYWNRSK